MTIAFVVLCWLVQFACGVAFMKRALPPLDRIDEIGIVWVSATGVWVIAFACWLLWLLAFGWRKRR